MLGPNSPLLLGSRSPRRREILGSLGLPFVVHVAPVDETRHAGEAPGDYLDRIVEAKRQAVEPEFLRSAAAASLVADTSVIVDGQVLGKPADGAEAASMLTRLSGRQHEVWTRFAVSPRPELGGLPQARTVVTRVRFRALTVAEIEGYSASGEGLDKAGAYAIQGLGSFAVSGIEGSYSNVVGLPACELVLCLRELGLVAAFPMSEARSGS